jgi:hypothetical protein
LATVPFLKEEIICLSTGALTLGRVLNYLTASMTFSVKFEEIA